VAARGQRAPRRRSNDVIFLQLSGMTTLSAPQLPTQLLTSNVRACSGCNWVGSRAAARAAGEREFRGEQGLRLLGRSPGKAPRSYTQRWHSAN